MSIARVGSRRIVTGIGTSQSPASVPTTATPVRRITATRGTVDNPETLVRFLNSIQDILAEATLGARSAPDLGAVILGPYVGAAQVVSINHGLGRNPVSVTCVRAIGAAWTGYEVTPVPADVNPTKTTQIQMPMTGTFYLRFA